MKSAKDEIRGLLEELPDDVSLDAALYELHFRAKVIRGIEQAERGEVVSQEEARKRLARWLESPGRSGSIWAQGGVARSNTDVCCGADAVPRRLLI